MEGKKIVNEQKRKAGEDAKKQKEGVLLPPADVGTGLLERKCAANPQ